MFRPRHAYRSPITNRYRGKAKGCPVFNNITDIQSNMVEQHDECLECLAKIKNRSELYKNLADNNKPNNNVIKSLQRLSHSASNNRLKTCLQFLIIKVNEKSIVTPQPNNDSNNTDINSPESADLKDIARNHDQTVIHTRPQNKRQKVSNNKQPNHLLDQTVKHQHQQLSSPQQDQVSSTQDQVVATQDEHDCQTSPLTLMTTQTDETNPSELELGEKNIKGDIPIPVTIGEKIQSFQAQTHSSPNVYALSNTESSTKTTSTTTTSTSPTQTDLDPTNCCDSKRNIRVSDSKQSHDQRSKLQVSSDHDTSSTASWSSSYTSPPSPMSSASSSSSISSGSSHSSSSCSSALSPSLSPSPISSPDLVNELRGPRLKLSEEKIRKIKKRPILFDDYFMEHSFASTPTTSSGCSPGQHSNTTQNSDQSRIGFPTNNVVVHMFQAPPKFVNNLKPCNLPPRVQEPPPISTPPTPSKEMLNCAICGIKDKPPNIVKMYGQNSCSLCTRFFATFMKRPQQLYCAQDGDCLMTFDSRCQACWIKICLQKFDIEEEHRKTGLKYSPKLLSAPNVSLITIDTSSSR